jgi:hypothetical protein
MTVNPSIDPARMLEEQLAQASPDLLRELLGTFINTLRRLRDGRPPQPPPDRSRTPQATR